MTGTSLFGEEFTARLNTITKARLAEYQFGVSELADLKTAVNLLTQLKQHARTDEDFKSLW